MYEEIKQTYGCALVNAIGITGEHEFLKEFWDRYRVDRVEDMSSILCRQTHCHLGRILRHGPDVFGSSARQTVGPVINCYFKAIRDWMDYHQLLLAATSPRLTTVVFLASRIR